MNGKRQTANGKRQTANGKRQTVEGLGKPEVKRISEIDGLRGVAISLVIFVHFYVQQFSDSFRAISPELHGFLMNGAMGVDLFFVISGFLIGGILADHVSSNRTLKAFYLRRAFRIWPLYYLLLLLVFLPTISVSNGSARVPLESYLFFMQNISLCMGLLAVPMLGPLWSLAVEEHFYAFAPLVFRWLRPRNIFILVVAMIVTPPLLRMGVAHAPIPGRGKIVTFFTLCRLDPIGLGLLGAILWRKPHVKAFLVHHRTPVITLTMTFGLGSIFLCIPSCLSAVPAFGFIKTTWVSLFFLLLVMISLVQPEGRFAAVMRNRLLVFTGARCFFLYVFHMPIHSMMSVFIPDAHASTALAVVCCLIYAEISWRLLELPCIRYSHRWRYEDGQNHIDASASTITMRSASTLAHQTPTH